MIGRAYTEWPWMLFMCMLKHSHICCMISTLAYLSFLCQGLLNRHATFFFVPLCCQLINDESATCKKMIAETLKILLRRVSFSLPSLHTLSLTHTHPPFSASHLHLSFPPSHLLLSFISVPPSPPFSFGRY